MTSSRSALVVVVEEAEAAVAELRRELDPVAQLGVPAHVTVLFPFIPAAEIGDDDLVRLTTVFQGIPAFEHTFVSTAWFGDDVLWLATDAAAEFRVLTNAVVEAFPGYLPYEGEFEDLHPHLTIALRGSLAEKRAAELAVQPHLPISTVTRAVSLLAEQPSGRWEVARSFSLG